MWGIISTVFIVLYCFMIYYIGRRAWNVLGRFINSQKIFWGIFGFIALAFPASEIVEDFVPASAGLWLTITGGYSVVAVSYTFLILVIIDFIRLIDKGVGFIPSSLRESDKTGPVLGTAVVLIIFAVMVYGSWNARNPVVTKYELNIAKNAGDLTQLRIAMVSDIHYGDIIDNQRLKRMAEIINELRPDIIVFAGDIIEGNPGPERIRQLAGTFQQLPAKYGKYLVPGNHDRVFRNDSETLRYFEEKGITILKDDQIRVGDSFYVVGRDYPGHRGSLIRKELDVLMSGVDTALPVILLDHQPVDLDNAQKNKVDLQLSGHTHRGQVFPNHLITGRIYEEDWGLLKRDFYHLIVSSGYGTWGPPLRIGNRPEVVEVILRFAE